MPLLITQSLVIDGKVDENQRVIMRTTAANRLIAVKYEGPKDPRFILVPARWPRPVKRAADQLMEHLAHRGIPAAEDTVDAWVKSPIPRTLRVGHTGIHVDVKSELRRKVIQLTLDETILGFEIIE